MEKCLHNWHIKNSSLDWHAMIWLCFIESGLSGKEHDKMLHILYEYLGMYVFISLDIYVYIQMKSD